MRDDIPAHNVRMAMELYTLLGPTANYGTLAIVLNLMLDEDRTKLKRLQETGHHPEVTASVTASIAALAPPIEALMDAIMQQRSAAEMAKEAIRNTNLDGSPKNAHLA